MNLLECLSGIVNVAGELKTRDLEAANKILDLTIEAINISKRIQFLDAFVIVSPIGPDHVSIITNLPGAVWPYRQTLRLHFDCAAGSGVQYCRDVLGIPRVSITSISGSARPRPGGKPGRQGPGKPPGDPDGR